MIFPEKNTKNPYFKSMLQPRNSSGRRHKKSISDHDFPKKSQCGDLLQFTLYINTTFHIINTRHSPCLVINKHQKSELSF